MNPPIRLFVIDDHPLFRRGLISLLEEDERFTVVGEAGDVSEVLRVIDSLEIDLIILDNHLPGVKGVDAIASLKKNDEGLKILMLTVSEDEGDLAKALQNGADGYFLKTSDADELCEAIVKIHDGQSVVSPEMMTKLVAAMRQPALSSDTTALKTTDNPSLLLDLLSPREKEIFLLIAQSMSNKQIARDLNIAETTVKIHIQHIFKKLGFSSRVQIAIMAATHGLLH